MGDGALDTVILGASGFTAKYILREFMRHLERPEGQGRRRIGIAGRNQEKLGEALRWAAQGALQMPPLIPIIEAGVTDSASVSALCKRTRLIVNYVGPFHLYGESVLAACVEAGVDYLDITSEQNFMEMMEEHYHSSTLLTVSLIISACAYDYVTADLSVIFHRRQWKPLSVPHSVDTYVVLESEKRVVLKVTSFESAVVAIARAQEDQKLRTYGTLRGKLRGDGRQSIGRSDFGRLRIRSKIHFERIYDAFGAAGGARAKKNRHSRAQPREISGGATMGGTKGAADAALNPHNRSRCHGFGSMAALCKRTRLIVNCVGPFCLYDESVVTACVEAGVDYLDITGERKFMEMMEEHYHSLTVLTGSLIISACAYDYVTADLGVIFHSRQWKSLFVPHSVDAYVVLESEKRVVLNVTSFESAVVAIARAQEDQKLRTYRTLRVRESEFFVGTRPIF
ncbi:hypothetical protein SUGI_0258730 [Cryptomeria japonica]|nr:hypothetical protein SUGI_0258730 [Cryptomeria japonica]